MPKTTPEQNKAIVLKAFDTLFNQRNYSAAERFWSPKYIQHSAHIAPGREGLFALIRSAPDTLRYENQRIKVVGAAFAHESGIHQHGMRVNPLAYEIMTPESVGAGHTKLVLGKHSGRRALADPLEKLGHALERNQLDEVYSRFTELADRKKSIYDQNLLGLLQPGKSIPVATV
jgi:predicted SnoaL-like aldol condensation-catalyzing enzyme